MLEPVDFSSEHADEFQERIDRSRLNVEGCADRTERGNEFSVRPSGCWLADGSLAEFTHFAIQLVDSIRDTCTDVVVGLRHEVHAIRSRDERQRGSL
jgi:hypothetical protein